MGNAIFEDLEINHDDMLTNPSAFAKRVYEAADKLRTVCKADTSVSAIIARYEDENTTQFIPKELQESLDSFYYNTDSMSLEFMADAIKQAEKLVADLKVAFRDRAIREAAGNNENLANKRVAHAQYTRLKEDYNQYLSAMKVLFGDRTAALKPLPNMPGNYGTGGATFVNYVFTIDEEQYRNHIVVARKLSIPVGSLMDVIEYIQKNPDCGATVTTVTQ